jgi:dTDP-4-dehydrorhamnose reductase
MRLLLLGANGQLGSDVLEVARARGQKVVPFMGRQELDVTDGSAVMAAISAHRPDVVINTVARCDVDACEADTLLAFQVNALGARHVAQACQNGGARLIHISTDYVFSGDKGSPYVESDTPRPVNAYGVSKLAGEHFVRVACEDHLVVRSSGLYGVRGSREKGGNFVETMVRLSSERPLLKGVSDQFLSPTYTWDLAHAVLTLAGKGVRGVIHVCNEGTCSWMEWASMVFRLLGRSVRLEPVTMAEFPSVAQRPRYTALRTERLEEAGIEPLPPWQDALRRYLKQKGHLGRPQPGPNRAPMLLNT